VVDALLEDERRRFIWAEVCFFEKWWSKQKDSVRKKVRELASSGRLEFVGGGWVSGDEACTDLYGMVTQLTVGHNWLVENVGVAPSYGWSIDPFGHSALAAYLYALAGFDAIVINRVHKNTKSSFRDNGNLEFIWRQNWEHNSNSSKFDMMTHMFPYPLYDIPNTCGPDWDVCASFDFERSVAIPSTVVNSCVHDLAVVFCS
jgi:alpha-mannosidase II